MIGDATMQLNTWNKSLAVMLVAGMACGASAQLSSLKLNEILVDADGSQDIERQFIELSGCAGTSLEGIVIIAIDSVRSGAGTMGDPYVYTTEIDESWEFIGTSNKYKLNGTLGSGTGYFVLWSGNSDSTNPDTQAQNSDIWGILPASIDQNLVPGDGDLSIAATRYEASMEEVRNVPGGETAGTIKNDGSKTFLLIDWNASVAAATAASATLTLSDVEKDVDCDPDDDGILEGDLAYLVVIDEIAWAHQGGREFTLNEANEWDFSEGFSVEAVSRVDNTTTGYDADRYITDGSNIDNYRQVYRNWQAGEQVSWSAMAYQDGFGYAPRPTMTGIGNATVVDDSNGSLGNYGLATVNLTPGVANETAQVGASGCNMSLTGPDQNGDGVVNFLDLGIAAQTGDMAQVREVLEALR